MDDLISRLAAIKLLDEQIRQCSKAILSPDISLKDEYAARVERASLNAYREHLSSLPSVEAPDINVGNIDTISRQAVKDIFTELYGISAIGSVFDKYEWADICETTANELPSIQPDIIHCKDCKYWTHIKRTNRYWCKTDDGLFDLNPSPDDFCSRGERKTDERLDKQTAGD